MSDNWLKVIPIIVKFALALVATGVWLRLRRYPVFSVLVWWPISFFVSTMALSVINFVDVMIRDILPDPALEIWRQGLIIHGLAVLIYGGWVMYQAMRQHKELDRHGR